MRAILSHAFNTVTKYDLCFFAPVGHSSQSLSRLRPNLGMPDGLPIWHVIGGNPDVIRHCNDRLSLYSGRILI